MDDKELSLEKRIYNGTTNLFFFSILSLLNAVLLLIKSDLVFSFSAFLPQILITYGYYGAELRGDVAPLVVFSILAFIFLGCSLCCSLIATKKRDFLLPGMLLVIVDSVVMLIYFIGNLRMLVAVSLGSMLVQVFFHGWILWYIICAYGAHRSLCKKKKLPEGSFQR